MIVKSALTPYNTRVAAITSVIETTQKRQVTNCPKSCVTRRKEAIAWLARSASNGNPLHSRRFLLFIVIVIN